jgi:transcriptional regulator with XRE-family HTH domain
VAETLAAEDLSYAQRVGSRLRLIRKQKGLSLQEVEANSGQEFKASVLGAYERGERAISVPRLYRLAVLYNVPVDRLLPADAAIGIMGTVGAAAPDNEISLVDEERRSTPESSVTIDLSRLNDVSEPQADLLVRYLSMIQMQRQDFNGRMLTIRRDDLRAISCIFETTPESMRRRLDDLGLRLVI